MQLQVGKTYQSHRPAETIEMANGGIIKFIRNESAREKSKKAIFLYDRSGLMAQPWLDAGYECWLFDGQHEKGVHRYGNLVKVGMWFDPYLVNHHVREIRELVGEGVRFVFGFPECTDMAVSGAAHFKKKRAANPNFQKEAMSLAMMVKKVGDSFDCKWGCENPVSVLSTMWRKPDYSFHPWEYGGYLPENDIHPEYPEYIKPRDAYPKKTCIWSGNGFVMPEKNSVCVEPGYSDQHKKLGGKSQKTKNIRSATPRGFAKAVFIFNQ
ncbi:Dcm methylase [Vibrio cholerae]|uniref:Dcm methylase n=1 Tax=Vibrio cholerae TaxID=666 RepID=UPI001F26BB21|nr:Dcm methylase [Vibrio cholerae]